MLRVRPGRTEVRGVTIFGIQHDRIVRGRLYMEDVDRSCGNIDQLSGAWKRPPGCLRLPEALAAAFAAATAAVREIPLRNYAVEAAPAVETGLA
jgi:hypothetical protein